jgi:hypothetical protein
MTFTQVNPLPQSSVDLLKSMGKTSDPSPAAPSLDWLDDLKKEILNDNGSYSPVPLATELIVGLPLTALCYLLVPLTYRKGGKPLSKKKAKRILLLNSIVVCLGFLALSYALDPGRAGMNVGPAFFWYWIGYGALGKNIRLDEEMDREFAESQCREAERQAALAASCLAPSAPPSAPPEEAPQPPSVPPQL